MSTPSRWRYEAADASGVVSRGELEAASLDDAVDQLRRRALWVIDIEGASGTRDDRSDWRAQLAERVSDAAVRMSGSNDEALAVITRAIATLLQAGIPVERALAFAVAGETDRRWQSVFASLRDAVTRGESLSHAAASHAALPRSFAPLLAAAEASGSLADTFARLADDLERRGALRAQVRAALVYPSLLAAASIVGTLVILVVVVPRFADLITGVGGTVPTSTRVLIALSGFLARGWWIIAAALAAAIYLMRRSLHDPARRLAWHRARLRLPVGGRLEQEQAACNYLGTLAVALESGVPLLRAMTLARGTVANEDIAGRLALAEQVVRDGGSAAQALSGCLPPLATRLIEAGEQSGTLAPLARRAATSSGDQVRRQLNSAVALIEPAMILGFGAIVGFVALALLQAIYGLNANNFG